MNILKRATAVIAITFAAVTAANADTPITRDDGVTVIHLDEYSGYFSAEETVAGLKAGEYEFVITNKAKKLVGFQIQRLSDKETLDMFPLEPGETRISRVTIGEDGVRFRCPINPTPWYDLDVIKKG
ncbi:hypothetical protein EZV61_14650 [Corallincola luteus]|uniref:EfeO-type cupredoxin-like domain-containing protein n=1 Tax=Corallincola luteus TaxID=1775177 RepID=A0ABY2AI21_9GAMM|nr:hypothetical protein EZV61_14650 [Corallincola luteus]